MFLYLAPIRGITDYLFRTVFANHFQGFDAAIAPFVSSVKGVIVKASHLKDIEPSNNLKMPIIPQVIGKNPDEFIVMANQLAQMGYTSVNWNLGCPFPQVTRKKRGSGLLPYPEIIQGFLDDIIPKMPIGLSIKLRLGLSDKNDIKKLIPIFNAYPLTEIIIHARTGEQMYTGTVDVDSFEQCLAQSTHPVVFNGDITNAITFKILETRFPSVTSWMIGRGALIDPFLAESLRSDVAKTNAPKIRLKYFLDELVVAYSKKLDFDNHVLDKMKGLWLYLSHSFSNEKKVLKHIQKSNRLDGYKDFVNKVFEEESLIFYP